MWWGTLVGLGIGFWLAYTFIFPADILNIRLAAMTIGDLLRIFGGLVVTALVGAIGYLVDIGFGKA